MKAGKMRNIIEIQAVAITRDAGGGAAAETWTTVTNGRRAAQLLPLRSRERFAEEQRQSDITHVLRTRYLAGVTIKNRVLFGARILDVIGVLDWQERHVFLELECVERQAA